jgi:cytochrome c
VTTIVERLALILVTAWITPLAAAWAQDGERGREVFAACAPCHILDKNSIGPRLAGVIGRVSGSVEGFRYSRAMNNAGIVWEAKTLDSYLSEPQKVVPGNVMPFSRIGDAQKRPDIIAYLSSLKLRN